MAEETKRVMKGSIHQASSSGDDRVLLGSRVGGGEGPLQNIANLVYTR